MAPLASSASTLAHEAALSPSWGKRRFKCTCGLVIDLCSVTPDFKRRAVTLPTIGSAVSFDETQTELANAKKKADAKKKVEASGVSLK